MVLANIMGLGGPDVWIIAGIVVLLFGGAKLPGLMRSLGEGMKEFKKATHEMSGDSSEVKPAMVEAQAAPASVALARPQENSTPAVPDNGATK